MSILPDPPPEGESLRDAALALLRVHRAALVRDLTRAAVRLALERGTITADDVRSVVPIPPGIRPVVVGVALRDAADAGILRRIGYRPSTRPVAHARPLTVWRLTDPAAAVAWLDAHPPILTD
jgi:molybdopterin biosynthesis enzyme